MKQLYLLLNFFLIAQSLFSQETEIPTGKIEIQGIGKIVADPDVFRITFVLQEEEKRLGYQPVGKTEIDSLRLTFLKHLKTFGIEEKDVKLIKKTSREMSQYVGVLHILVFETIISDIKKGQKLVESLRVQGLKGVIVKGQYQSGLKLFQDSLNVLALEDAKRNAVFLAKRTGKKIGEMNSVRVIYNDALTLQREMDDLSDSYNLGRFEIAFNEKKKMNCLVQVSFNWE